MAESDEILLARLEERLRALKESTDLRVDAISEDMGRRFDLIEEHFDGSATEKYVDERIDDLINVIAPIKALVYAVAGAILLAFFGGIAKLIWIGK